MSKSALKKRRASTSRSSPLSWKTWLLVLALIFFLALCLRLQNEQPKSTTKADNGRDVVSSPKQQHSKPKSPKKEMQLLNTATSEIKLRLERIEGEDAELIQSAVDLIIAIEPEVGERIAKIPIRLMSTDSVRQVGAGTVNFEENSIDVYPPMLQCDIYGAGTIYHEFFHLENDSDNPNPTTSELLPREERAHRITLQFYKKIQDALKTGELTALGGSQEKVVAFTQIWGFESYFKSEQFGFYHAANRLALEHQQSAASAQIIALTNSSGVMQPNSSTMEIVLLNVRALAQHNDGVTSDDIKKIEERFQQAKHAQRLMIQAMNVANAAQ